MKNARLQREYGTSSWFGFGLVLQEDLQGRRKEVIELLTKNGVETRPIVAGNFMKNPVIDRLNWDSYGTFGAADDIDQNGFFIGNDCHDLKENITRVAELIGAIK
jgi:CDP-4-dehydro-6-deoxyglucose reductase, E1